MMIKVLILWFLKKKTQTMNAGVTLTTEQHNALLALL